jgi:hypothetical protein
MKNILHDPITWFAASSTALMKLLAVSTLDEWQKVIAILVGIASFCYISLKAAAIVWKWYTERKPPIS